MALRVVETKLVQLTREVDTFVARELATQMAEGAGFDAYQTADIEIAVSEICSNALRYGVQGWAALTITPDGFKAAVTDEGPGFGVASARSGLGVGLEGARRLMDDLSIEGLAGGSRVTIKKRLRAADEPREPPPHWELAVVNRLKKGNSTSGDKWWCRQDSDAILLAVIDGLGSGPQAEEAARVVIATLAAGPSSSPLDRLVQSAHNAARATRGAVGVVARIDGSTIAYCGVGDVSGRIDPGEDTVLPAPGIMGVELGEPQVRHHEWSGVSRLWLWTDGLSVPPGALTDLEGPSLPDALEALAHRHGTPRDDGLLLFVRPAAGWAA